jgi:hypothetical protein
MSNDSSMAAEPSKGMVFSLSLKVGLWRASDGTRQHAPAARAAHHRGTHAMGVPAHANQAIVGLTDSPQVITQ